MTILHQNLFQMSTHFCIVSGADKLCINFTDAISNLGGC